MNKQSITLLLFVLLAGAATVHAQDEGFIYGKITTVEGTTYEGPIRWGKEEVYWTDHFNASKEKNPNLRYLSNEDMDYLESRWESWTSTKNWGFNFTWSSDEDFVHQFGCQFGAISRIRPTGSNSVEVTMRNGDVFSLDGNGYNDVGTKVKIMDDELGTLELYWDRITEIVFKDTPSQMKNKFGEPLYGTVEGRNGTFTGLIQWDHDERVGTDMLDGDAEDGDVSIPFNNIQQIERIGSSRSKVILKSGREFSLSGSNDVNSENRGIIVIVDGVGHVDIPWKEFDKVTFTKAPDAGPAYKTFGKPTKLTGTVAHRNGEKITGDLVFDLDEEWNFELLNGKLNDTDMVIPFANVSAITPLNYDNCRITLQNGGQFVLGDAQDVSDKNQGVLVVNGSKTRYIRYEDISEITF